MPNLFNYDQHSGKLEIICDLVDYTIPEFITQVKELVASITPVGTSKLPLVLSTMQVANMDTVGFATLLAMLKVLADKFEIKIVASSRIRKFAKLYYLEDFLSGYYIRN